MVEEIRHWLPHYLAEASESKVNSGYRTRNKVALDFVFSHGPRTGDFDGPAVFDTIESEVKRLIGLGVVETQYPDPDLGANPFRLVSRQVEPVPHSFDSSTWTGLPKKGSYSDQEIHRLKIALLKVEDAVEKSGATNSEFAQARAYVIAMKALADAPDPPAEHIWKLVLLLSAMSSIGQFVTALVELYN